MIRKKYPHLLHCVLMAALCSIAIFIYYVIGNEGFFTVTADFDRQQIPFTIDLHRQLANGLDSWVWNYELGQSLIKAFGFSAVGSPFFWMSMPFPAEAFPYVAAWIYCIKYVAAAIFAYLYLIEFLRDDRYALVGALLYAFSGFQSVNLVFYSFHDVVALFPLLLIGLEKCMDDGRMVPFIFSVFINCTTNYFFFVQEVIFVSIYFACRFFSKDVRLLLERVGRCLLCGVLGVAMAGMLFVPSAVYMLASPRMDVGQQAKPLFCSLRDGLQVLKGLLLPAESLHDQSSVMAENMQSVNCWLPFVGMTGVLAYVRKNRDWLTGLIVACLVISFVPLLSSAFMLFTEVYYRWWFMFSLMLALATVKAFENMEGREIFIAAVANCVLVLVLPLLIYAGGRIDSEIEIYSVKWLGLICAMSAGGAGLTGLLFLKPRERAALLCIGICIFSVISAVSVMSRYKRYVVPGGKDVKAYVELGTKLDVIDEQYRYAIEDNNCLAMCGDASAMSSFCSTRHEGSIEFDAMFGHFLGFSSMNKASIEGLTSLLGGKFYISNQTDGSHLRHYTAQGEDYYVHEQIACPIGFAMDSYIVREELDTVPEGRRGVALLQAAVVEEESADKLQAYANRVSALELDLAADVEKLSIGHQQDAVMEFERNNKGFSCRVDYESDCLIYFSVPMDSGWRAFVDGTERELINSAGMMLLPVEAGEHSIEVNYSCPGYKIGLMLSGLGFAVFFVLLWLENKKKHS